MRHPRIKAVARQGFTLVELLVVIGIILVLIALFAGTVVQVMSKVDVVRTSTDISQLGVGLQSFKSEYKFYPPSRLKLCEYFVMYDMTQTLDQDSVGYITTMAPRIMDIWNVAPSSGGGIDWNCDGIVGENDFYILEGDQCLVFFLGGRFAPLGQTPGCFGFSADPRNPWLVPPQLGGPAGARKGPFYDFKTERLAQLYTGNTAPFRSYLDPNGRNRPFAYFSAGRNLNGYSRYSDIYGNSDCASLGIWPFYEAPGRYHKPDSFQIISAGRNGLFGPGGQWTRQLTGSAYQIGTPGGDDQSNVSEKILGAPPG